MKISKEIKTGILVVLGILLFIFGFKYLKGQNLLESNNTYYTEFNYNALTPSSVVTVKGNPVGKVTEIKYDYATGKTRVAFLVNEQLKFSKNSKIRMYETGLMGGNGLAIIISKDGELAKPGDVLESEVEVGLVSSLSKNFSGLSSDLDLTLKSADTLMSSLNRLVKDDSNQGLKATIYELNQTLKSFKGTSNSVNSLIGKNDASIEELLVNFKTMSADLSVVVSELKEANLGNIIATLNSTLTNLNGVLDKVNKGDGTLGKLVEDEALYNNLEGATKELEALLQDIKLHPKRYFRILSKKEIPYEEPQTN
ncbi:mammalian cell entry protein [Tamlana sedimentorum]|uniref:Mammalian cell entry protein n=1 Tax=Neotamlana sedimentorum TaxID=1435349 RepID=A0A0D7WEU7_9FLAO|nr:MlaD family protein [Tamlana sedimentorum]KJD36242.1 mammalian cell entry protein [Tamlana sedimentorum]